uniref:Uncharacterized protein n=1 Tax=Sphaerodactylus townsendi TaxID=933632 RepID=A0ACB8FMT9_9SAUR
MVILLLGLVPTVYCNHSKRRLLQVVSREHQSVTRLSSSPAIPVFGNPEQPSAPLVDHPGRPGTSPVTGEGGRRCQFSRPILAGRPFLTNNHGREKCGKEAARKQPSGADFAAL